MTPKAKCKLCDLPEGEGSRCRICREVRLCADLHATRLERDEALGLLGQMINCPGPEYKSLKHKVDEFLDRFACTGWAIR